jgi:hypothetical protein
LFLRVIQECVLLNPRKKSQEESGREQGRGVREIALEGILGVRLGGGVSLEIGLE